MNISKFDTHGNAIFSIQGQILFIRTEGQPNAESIAYHTREVKKYKEKLRHAPWCSLVIPEGTPLLPPEGRAHMLNAIRESKSMNMIATAAVFKDVEFKEIAKTFWEQLYAEVGAEYRVFEEEQPALEWLSRKLRKAEQ